MIILCSDGKRMMSDEALIELINRAITGEIDVVVPLKNPNSDAFITLRLPHPPTAGESLVSSFQRGGWPYVCIRCVTSDGRFEFELGALGLTPAQSVLRYLLHEEQMIARIVEKPYEIHSIETNVNLSDEEWREVDRGLRKLGWKKGCKSARSLANSPGGQLWKYTMRRV